MTRIEHVNITVPDIDAAISFLKIVAPDFEVRKDNKPADNYRWVHIGNDSYYFALVFNFLMPMMKELPELQVLEALSAITPLY